MARRRFNKNFLVGAVAVPVALGGGVGLWLKLKPKDPEKYIALSNSLSQKGDLPDAASALSAASLLRPTDAELHLKLANLYYQLKDQDPSALQSAIEQWQQAEEINPDLKQAWQGLLEANMLAAASTAQNRSRLDTETQYLLPKRFGIARDAAQHLLKLDPNDPKARSAIPILTINLWMLNLAIPMSPAEQALPIDKQPTDAQRIDQAVTDLTAIMRDHPEDSDLPLWIAQAKVNQARLLMARISSDNLSGTTPDADNGGGPGQPGDRTSEVRALFGEAAVAFDDSIARRPADPELYYKKFQVLTLLMQVDRSPAAIVQYQHQQQDALEHAQANANPADPELYAAYKAKWAAYVSRTDPARAEMIYKDLLKQRDAANPGAGTVMARNRAAERLLTDVRVRLQYATMLASDQTRRADALAVLDGVPTVPPQDLSAAALQQVSKVLADARLLRAQVLTDQLENTVNPTLRAALASRATAEIDAADQNPREAEGVDVLKARGRLQLVDGQFRDAIQTLSQAADRQATSGAGLDFRLLALQANAYAQGQQNGEAIKLLEKAVRDPAGANTLQPHQMLAHLYLQEQDYDDARAQVGWLAERYPDSVGTIQLQIQALGRDPDPKDVAPLYNRLPERTTAEQVDKAGWAQRTNNNADAERLYGLVLKTLPGETSTSIRLAQLYAHDKNLGDANTVLQAAMDAHPGARGSLQIVKDEINGASEGSIEEEAQAQVDQIKDPMTREMAMAHLAVANNQPKAQIAHLEKALAIQPDNRDALNSLFVAYLGVKDFAKAAGLIQHLSDVDADQAHGVMFRFKLAMAQNDTGTALALGRQLTHDYPQFSGSWELLGEALQAAGQLDAAAQQYTAALDRGGNNPQAMQRLVACLIKLGRLDDARRYLVDARKKYPDDPVYREQQVRLELGYGDPETVLSIVDDAVKDHPDMSDAYQMAVQAYAAAAQQRTARADADGAAQFNGRIRDLLTAALKRWPDNVLFATELAQKQAEDRTSGGVADAAATFEALGATPRWQRQALPDVLLGQLYLQAKRPEDAEPPLRKALEIAPNSTDARTLLADALYEQHQPQAALDVLAPAREQPAVQTKYVDLLLTLNRGPEAEAQLLADLKAHPTDPAPANLLAHVYAAQGKWDAAMDTADRTLAADPKDAAAYFIRGTTEADRPHPDLDGAARDLSVFRTAYPDNVQGRVALARVMEARHDIDGATRELEAAVELAPDNKDARIRLTQAYLAVTPPRTLDAEHVISQTLTMPQFAHDADAQRVAAVVWLKQGANDRAVNSIRDAMAHTADQHALLDEYFNILLATRHYDLLLSESDKFTGDPKTPWTVYDFRGRARAASGDTNGAYADFSTALDVAGTARTLGPALVVAEHVTDQLGIDRAAQMIGPRAENSASWKGVLASCYNQVHDVDKALPPAEGAMASLDTFTPSDQRLLTRMTSTLYMTAVPPQPDKALPLLRDLLRQDPDDIDALNNASCVLTELTRPPQPQEALRYSTHAYDLVRKSGQMNPYIYDTQGWDLILNGRVDDGIDVLHQVVDQANFPDAHYHLAEGYMRQGLPEDAKRELNAAVDVYKVADAAHQPIDASMKEKVLAAQKAADKMIQDKLQDKPQAQATP